MIITVTDYTLSGKTITLNNLDFSPDLGNLLYVFNKTQNELYYVPAEGFALASMSGDVITINSTFNDLADGDVLHIQIDNTGYTQAISAVSLPLPTLASTSTGQASLLTELKLKADLTETQPVSVASLPLPASAATAAKQLADGHNVAVSNMIPAVETGLATSAKQLADDHNVTVSNMIAAVETGLATSDNQTDGSQKTVITGQENITRHVWVNPTNEIATSPVYRVVGTNFDGSNKDTNFWTDGSLLSGSVTQGGGEIELNTNTAGATAASSAKYTSVRKARFVAGSAQLFQGGFNFVTAATANNIRRVGAYTTTATINTPVDGFYFELNNATFSVNSRAAAGAVNSVSSGSFNGNIGTTWTPTADTYYLLAIEFTPLAAFFYVNGELLHSMPGAHLSDFMTLPITIENLNTSGSTNVTLDCVGAYIARQGELRTEVTSNYQSGTTAGVTLKQGAGNLHGGIISDVVAGSIITIYDSLSATGKVIYASGSMEKKTNPFNIDFYKLQFSTGLTLAITVQNSNVTLVYE